MTGCGGTHLPLQGFEKRSLRLALPHREVRDNLSYMQNSSTPEQNMKFVTVQEKKEDLLLSPECVCGSMGDALAQSEDRNREGARSFPIVSAEGEERASASRPVALCDPSQPGVGSWPGRIGQLGSHGPE